MGTNRLTQPEISAVNRDELSSMPSVKGLDKIEASSAALHIPPEVGINKVGESNNFINSISWKYLTKFILDVIKASEV